MTAPTTPRPATGDPIETLRDLTLGKWISQAIYVAAELGIADHLKDGPRTVAALAAATGASADGVARLMRALVGLGVFADAGDARFKLAPMGELLRSDLPVSLRGWVRYMGHDVSWRPWGQLVESVRTGEPAFDRIFGMGAFDYMSAHPDVAAIFNDAMTAVSMMETMAVVAAYDFAGITTLADVGGGHGFLLASILKAHPQMRGILFDLAHAEEGAAALLAREGVADRCRIESGDMFARVPEGADACIMKHIIHDWDDAHSLTLLGHCHRALPAGGKLLIVDVVVPPGDEPHFGKILDLEMLVVTHGGRERDKAEFRRLLAAAGFTLTRVVPTLAPVSVVEGVKS
jgi:SAM-dependent methyltransferase